MARAAISRAPLRNWASQRSGSVSMVRIFILAMATYLVLLSIVPHKKLCQAILIGKGENSGRIGRRVSDRADRGGLGGLLPSRHKEVAKTGHGRLVSVWRSVSV